MNVDSKPSDKVLGLMTGYQAGCVVGAGAELDVYSLLAQQPRTAAELAAATRAKPRGMEMLLDALCALEVLKKDKDIYSVSEEFKPSLIEKSPQTVLAMVRHQMTCLRAWSELARVVRTDVPAKRRPSIRGRNADRAAFIQAMDNISGPMAEGVVEKLRPLSFAHLLDVGGASGTYTIAFLKANPPARATLFDLPDAIKHAQKRLKQNGLSERVALVAGDFYTDELPSGADYAWVSAIIHQNSRAQNRDLFAKVARALRPGGRIVIRDIIMEDSRTAPKGGALFAINMLVNTPLGGTFTLKEIDADLQASGFGPARQLVQDPWMNSLVEATKP